MAIDANQLRREVIRPTLEFMGMHSEAAENLLLGTAAHESHLGRYLHQLGGPALGIYQVEPATLRDVRENFLRYRPELHDRVRDLLGYRPSEERQLVTNLAFSTAIARLVYYRDPEPLPAAGDLEGLARYYKRVFNTVAGKATEAQFIQAYRTYAL